MEETIYPFLHIIHILTVILWIGGLGFITILILPMVVKMPDALQKVLLFQRIEHRFAPIARYYTVIVGVTGVSMFFILDLTSIVFTKEGMFLLIMIAIWVFWVVMLFGLEPLIVKRILDNLSKQKGKDLEIEDLFNRMNILHFVLLFLSLTAATSGIIFAHSHF